MTLLPIIEREVRVRARSGMTYWVRMVVGLAGALLCTQQLIVSGPLNTPAVVGRRVFDEMTSTAFLLCCSACVLAVEAINTERREGTLGLLFLTRVRSFDVLAGKLVSVGATSLCALAALVPALMIPVLAGGVTGAEAFRRVAALLATLLFALGAGLCGAAAQAQRFKAVCAAVLIVVVTTLGPGVFLRVTGGAGFVGHLVGLLSPLILMFAGGEVPYQASPGLYWGSLATVPVLGLALLAAAGFLLQRSIGRDGGAEVLRPPPPAKDLERTVGLGRWRPAKEEAGPMEWLVYRQHGVSLAAWAAAVVALAFSRWASVASKPLSVTGAPAFWVLAWPLGLAAALGGGAIVAWTAGRFFARVRRTGELELLLPTPVGAEDLVSDQWRVLKRMYAWPVLALQAGTLVPVAAMTGWRSAGFLSAMPLESALTAVLGFVNTFLGTGALCWLGLWFGLTARRQTNAILYAVSLAQGVPWLASLVGLALGVAGVSPFSRGLPVPVAVVSWLPEVVILVFYLGLIRLAQRRLRCELTGAESTSFNLHRSLSLAARDAVAAIRTARRWTPS
jgi:hypothetical protein